MSELLANKAKSMKDKIASLQSEIDRLEKENSAGLLSMIEKMKIPSLIQAQKDYKAKLRELLT